MGSDILERKNKQQTILIREASQQTKNIGSLAAAINTFLIFTWAIRSSCMGVHRHHNHNHYHPEEEMASSPAFLPPQHESLPSSSSSSSTNYIGNTKLKQRRYIIQNSNINDVTLAAGGLRK